MGMRLPRTNDKMTETEFQSLIIQLAKTLGLLVYHTHDSRRSQSGFPDLVIVGTRTIFAELKTEKGQLSSDQETWIERLREAGSEVFVWHPSDWNEIGKTLVEMR